MEMTEREKALCMKILGSDDPAAKFALGMVLAVFSPELIPQVIPPDRGDRRV